MLIATLHDLELLIVQGRYLHLVADAVIEAAVFSNLPLIFTQSSANLQAVP